MPVVYHQITSSVKFICSAHFRNKAVQRALRYKNTKLLHHHIITSLRTNITFCHLPSSESSMSIKYVDQYSIYCGLEAALTSWVCSPDVKNLSVLAVLQFS